jgi:murein DD-endopeptidase MepM/ murein hydrolase activator NlpD
MFKNMKAISIMIIALVISGALIFLGFGMEKNINPRMLYRVYLDGKELGLIKSKKQLEAYINKKQVELKKKYKLDKIYAPMGLKIEKELTYSNNVTSSKNIYEKIKNKKPFTINGYTITIKGTNETKIYVTKKTIFNKAVNNTIKAFINPIDYNNYLKSQQKEIVDFGKKIENIYVAEETTIKKEHISTTGKIFTNEDELTRYLLFGTLEEQKHYTVQLGDTIDKVAFNNSLSVEEFLVANPKFNDSTNLLYAGEQVNIGLINPKLSVVEECHLVEKKEKEYKTEIKYDSKILVGNGYELQKGVNGQDKVTAKTRIVNGNINNVQIVSVEEIKPAISRIYVKGGKTIASVGEKGFWAWPTTPTYFISSSFGYRWGKLHEAIDITGCGQGSPIYASNNGVVYEVDYDFISGNHVIINHNNGYYTFYGHLSKTYVKTGQSIERGQIIGGMGQTGFATGTHLHYGVYIGGPPFGGGRPINPLSLYR